MTNILSKTLCNARTRERVSLSVSLKSRLAEHPLRGLGHREAVGAQGSESCRVRHFAECARSILGVAEGTVHLRIVDVATIS